MRRLVVLAGIAAAIGGAAPAQADPGPDAGFLAALDQAGVPYHSAPVAIAVGKKECQLMDQGQPQFNVIQDLSASNPGFSPSDASKFTTAAVGAYCPQHLGDPTTPPPPPPPPVFWPDLSLPALPAAA